MLNQDCQWDLSDQIESRSMILRNGVPNYNSSRRLNNRGQMLQPPDPRNTQPCIRGACHCGKMSSHTIPKTTFNNHHNTSSRDQTCQMTQNSRHAHPLTIFGAASA